MRMLAKKIKNKGSEGYKDSHQTGSTSVPDFTQNGFGTLEHPERTIHDWKSQLIIDLIILKSDQSNYFL